MENNTKINIGCTTPGMILITLAFFAAKIFDKIDWSWWWVFSPLWIPLCVILVLGIIYIVIKIILWK